MSDNEGGKDNNLEDKKKAEAITIRVKDQVRIDD